MSCWFGDTWEPAATWTDGKLECRLGKTQFPVLIPRQHISTLVYLEYLGLDEVNYKGKKVDLHRFRLDLEDGPLVSLAGRLPSPCPHS